MHKILTGLIFVCWVIAGACGIVALVLIYLKKPIAPVITVFGVCVAISFVALLIVP